MAQVEVPVYSHAMLMLFAAYVFLLGAITGSFLNVVIHRLPLGESVVFPPSRCPSCRERIAPYDNIPVISWLLLRGRCRNCGVPISTRYPLVEAANGLLWLAVWLHLGTTVSALLLSILLSMIVVLIFIDLDVQFLPDVIDLPGIVLALLLAHFGSRTSNHSLVLADGWRDALIGAVAGGGVLWVIRAVHQRIRGVEGMGLGDVKMLAMIGAICGWRAVPGIVFLASLSGAVFGVSLALRNRENLQFAIPFGVFLGFAAIAVIFFGNPMFAWYQRVVVFGLAQP